MFIRHTRTWHDFQNNTLTIHFSCVCLVGDAKRTWLEPTHFWSVWMRGGGSGAAPEENIRLRCGFAPPVKFRRTERTRPGSVSSVSRPTSSSSSRPAAAHARGGARGGASGDVARGRAARRWRKKKGGNGERRMTRGTQ